MKGLPIISSCLYICILARQLVTKGPLSHFISAAHANYSMTCLHQTLKSSVLCGEVYWLAHKTKNMILIRIWFGMQGGDLMDAIAVDRKNILRWSRKGSLLALDIAKGLVHLHTHKVLRPACTQHHPYVTERHIKLSSDMLLLTPVLYCMITRL